MRELKTLEGLQCCLSAWQQPALAAGAVDTASVGLVPTMGALHRGHLSLVHRARGENDRVVVTIFVNPLQFAPGEDLDQYPRTLEADLAQCKAAGVDAVFCPSPITLYGGEPQEIALTQVVPPPELMAHLCGPYRPGHFAGVTTVVAKLLNLVQPHRVYFGEKDAQQLAILRRLVADLNWPVTVVGCPTVREPDGLALSSRNQYLTPAERTQASLLYQGLQVARDAFEGGERRAATLVAMVQKGLAAAPDLRPQYVELVHPVMLQPLEQVETTGLLAIAAYLGRTRLIDNLLLRSRQPIVAIDGPAGAGKSTVTRLVADALGLLYLDTGAMYRAVTWRVLQVGIDPKDEVAVAELLADCIIRLAPSPQKEGQPSPSQVWVNGVEVTQAIRSPEVTALVSTVAAQPMVRQVLLRQQQDYGQAGGVVMEGRDIGTQVFPEAEVKIFLTASVQERARRRQRDLAAQNQPATSLEALEKAIDERDRKDSTRRVAPLRKAADAVEVVTDGLTIEQVVAKIVSLCRRSI
ncbi:bifunctional pantoate--beta-alanine ligase/(d)CMP kinase [Leptolyngbya sp. PCC 6406]|uniref:bifunctional pantoate--beta-alanine ligase/(d)CMP kinase n=1 Tax=Leptolyngbya sp. PCC 6406 TaxID=1173264 RepID=UPI0002AC7DF8|nr:bifunctional pantoate--beta-alanine ligase/(d)CMP kinase [Leptolyngbya sp. PCC 6406]